MNGCMAFPAERLQIGQRVVAGVSGAAPSGAAAIQMVDGEIAGGSAALARKAVALQRRLPVSAKAVVVFRRATITLRSFLGSAFGSQAHGLRLLRCGTIWAAGFWSAVIDVVGPTAGAAIDRSDNPRTSFAAKSGEVFAVVLGADMRHTRRARLLACAGRLVGYAAFLADALAIAVACLSVSLQRTTRASLCVRRTPDHSCATAGANNGSVSPWRHAEILRREVANCPAS